jgi:stearoyl-CoA desaturase (delta-9 desaturase)
MTAEQASAPVKLPLKHRAFLVSSTVMPPAGVAVAIALLWNDVVGWTDLVVLVLLYTLTGLGMSLGFHRLLAHRSYKTTPALRTALAALGTMAAHGPRPSEWTFTAASPAPS